MFPVARVRRQRRWVGLMCLLSALSTAAWPLPSVAQDAENPPDRVGRIALLQGLASYRPTAQDPWAGAVLNTPMTNGTALWTEPGAKAEIEIGAARVWMDGGTEIDVAQIDDRQVQLNLVQGRADIHLGGRRPDESYIVNTPSGSASLAGDGFYRVVAGDQQNPARLAVFAGTASFADASDNQGVGAGGEAVIEGNPPQIQTAAASEDDFDQWAEGRERHIAEAVSARFVPPGEPGAADLDQYGQWRTVPDYGNVWVPTGVASDWAPYRDGHWQWIAPWGWTWVDNAPWGFAPFHYGRWVNLGGWWAWAPGPVAVAEPPVYAPALVTFIGDPGSVVVDGGGPCVGWVPLGPGEIYAPTWFGIGVGAAGLAVSFDFFHRMNYGVPPDMINRYNHGGRVDNRWIEHNRGDHATYVNQRFVTVVNRNTFINAQSVQHGLVHVRPGAEIRPGASFREAALPSTPTRQSRLGPSTRTAATPPRTAFAASRVMPALHSQPRAYAGPTGRVAPFAAREQHGAARTETPRAQSPGASVPRARVPRTEVPRTNAAPAFQREQQRAVQHERVEPRAATHQPQALRQQQPARQEQFRQQQHIRQEPAMRQQQQFRQQPVRQQPAFRQQPAAHQPAAHAPAGHAPSQVVPPGQRQH
jgi:hypothetical protein